MPVYRIYNEHLYPIPETTFAAENFRERQDLQRLIKNDISILAPGLKVLKEEFTDWHDSDRRIDLLCLDDQGRLTVVELKRGLDGGHMELQAIRYAAMISSMTFAQVVNIHARGNSLDRSTAQAELLLFLNWDSERELNPEIRIILVSADFSVEITTAVLWLNKVGLNITCIRAKPYRLDAELLIDLQQIIPLPEAADYEVKLRAREQENRKIRSTNEVTWSGTWYVNVGECPTRSWEDMRRYGFVAAGGSTRFIRPLQKIKIGDQLYAYQSGRGYVGCGTATTIAMPATDFQVDGTSIANVPLEQPGLIHDTADPSLTEWVVGVAWTQTLPLTEAKTFSGVFAYPGSVCRLTHIETLTFLKSAFQNAE